MRIGKPDESSGPTVTVKGDQRCGTRARLSISLRPLSLVSHVEPVVTVETATPVSALPQMVSDFGGLIDSRQCEYVRRIVSITQETD
jgi:hypothetical protein